MASRLNREWQAEPKFKHKPNNQEWHFLLSPNNPVTLLLSINLFTQNLLIQQPSLTIKQSSHPIIQNPATQLSSQTINTTSYPESSHLATQPDHETSCGGRICTGVLGLWDLRGTTPPPRDTKLAYHKVLFLARFQNLFPNPLMHPFLYFWLPSPEEGWR